MTGLYLTVPIACFRKGLAREFFETEPLPPPSTCYGFLLSLVGEENRSRHAGVAVAPAIRGEPVPSTVLRTLWRIKKKSKGNTQPSVNRRPDYQQILLNLEILIWLDSSHESHPGESLEDRVRQALDPHRRKDVTRFGGLSLGESTHLVNEVHLLRSTGGTFDPPAGQWQIFLVDAEGSHTFPVWVDHVGTKNTRHITGHLLPLHDPATPPDTRKFCSITP